MCIVDFYKVPIPLSLSVIVGILVLAVLASIWRKPGGRREQREVTTTP
jgi:hypothetical protein